MTRGPDKQFDRDEVLDRAMELFWQRGYEATGMSALLEHMGIGRQSLYDTFGDKRSLFLEALNRYVGSMIGPVIAQLRAPGSPMGNIKKVFERLELLVAEPHPGCFVGNSLAEFGHADSDLSKMLHGYLKALEEAFHDALVRAKKTGELKSKLRPRDLARTMVTASQGVALITKVKPDRELARSVARTTLHMLQNE
jgi:TetR/AcrR family transcriptional repressor of nem operon